MILKLTCDNLISLSINYPLRNLQEQLSFWFIGNKDNLRQKRIICVPFIEVFWNTRWGQQKGAIVGPRKNGRK